MKATLFFFLACSLSFVSAQNKAVVAGFLSAYNQSDSSAVAQSFHPDLLFMEDSIFTCAHRNCFMDQFHWEKTFESHISLAEIQQTNDSTITTVEVYQSQRTDYLFNHPVQIKGTYVIRDQQVRRMNREYILSKIDQHTLGTRSHNLLELLKQKYPNQFLKAFDINQEGAVLLLEAIQEMQ